MVDQGTNAIQSDGRLSITRTRKVRESIDMKQLRGRSRIGKRGRV